MFVRRGRAALAVATATLAIAGARADASPLELYGFGARSPAMAGTGVASSDGYEAVYLNPAGLARVTRKRATVGVLAGSLDLALDGEDTNIEPARGLVIGAELPLPLGGSMRDRVGLGFGFYIPAVAINRARQPLPGTPAFTLLENRSHVIALQFAAGVRVRDDLDVGVGVIALAVLRGEIAVSTDSAGRFATTSEQRLLTRFAPILGARWRARDGLDLGVVLRGTSRSDYDIEVTTDIAEVVPIQLPPIRIAGNAQYDPLTVAAEAAWRPRPGLLASVQVQWQRWSAFPLPTQNPTTGTPAQEPPGFHDTVVPRIGVEVTHALGGARLAARAGAAFAMSPAPEATGRQSFLDNDRVIGAVGVGLAFPGSRVPVFVDAWVQHHYLVPRTHAKDAGAFDPGDPLPFDVLEADGQILVGGVSVGVGL